jgi:hypothetical protein
MDAKACVTSIDGDFWGRHSPAFRVRTAFTVPFRRQKDNYPLPYFYYCVPPVNLVQRIGRLGNPDPECLPCNALPAFFLPNEG